MQRTILCLGIFLAMLACRNDETYKQNESSEKVTQLRLELTSRVGGLVDASLATYIHSLNLLLFRQNDAGDYTLYRQKVLNKEQLLALENADHQVEAGFTAYKEISFDTIPVGTYQIVGLGNMLDSLGNVLVEATLQGAVPGNTMEEIVAAVKDGDQSPRLFLGATATIEAGGATDALPVLRLYRKVAMFSLTLLKIPEVVDQIHMEFEHTYGKFNMTGAYDPSSEIVVYGFNTYEHALKDSITLNYIMLPTIQGDSTSVMASFYLAGGAKQNITLPEYVLRPNTIVKVTATIDTDQPGGVWKVDVNSLITVNVEWNVDQEPPITI